MQGQSIIELSSTIKHTYDGRCQIDGSKTGSYQLCILVVNLCSKKWDIATLFRLSSEYIECMITSTEPTPYDSPAMWRARPLNEEKFSKKIATNAAISLAASSVVSCRTDIKKLGGYDTRDVRHVHRTPRTRSRLQQVDQRKIHWHLNSSSPGGI